MNFRYELLEFLKDILAGLPKPFETPYEYSKRLTQLNYYGTRKFHDQIKSLSKEGLIKIEHDKSKQYFYLTKKATIFLNKQPKLVRRRDNLITLITFDIPVSKNRERTIFRRYLLKLGFTQIQKSTLIGDYYVWPELKGIIKNLRITNRVQIFSALKE